MAVDTKEEKSKVKNKLEYIGLDLNSIPEFIKQNPALEFRPSKTFGEENFKVYKYIDVRDIKILLTPKNRLDMLDEKYKLASSLYSYIEPKTESDIIKHTTFLKMLDDMQIEKVEEIEEEQKKLNKHIPFRVKYEHNYLWQIFYDEYTKQYFMLVTTEDKDYEAFFYLLKEQIKSFKEGKESKIYVPICYQYYENDFLKKSEIADLEKYLWLFTKQWPSVYEVYDKDNNMSIQIVGNTYVYEKIKSPYKIKLENKEETIKFFNLIKALFIMQTELPHYYQFETKISQDGALEFLVNGKLIEYDNLSKMIKDEAVKYQENIKEMLKETKEKKEKLEDLKIKCKKKEEEYLNKEKNISIYLECRKTFFGRIKYYFKSKKLKQQVEESTEEEEKQIKEEKIETFNFKKEFYTIENLIEICKKADEIETKLKNIQLDIKAIENKLERLTKKVENANLYIQEIDSHKKSIFEFWKYTNKDEDPKLPVSEEQEEENSTHLAKTFDYEEDIEDLANEWDKFQRDKFTKEECDSIYLTSTNILKYLQKEEIQDNDLEEIKRKIQTESQNFVQDSFDIFGAVTEDKTKIKTLANKKHRENNKNMWKILEINQNTTKDECQEKIEEIKKHLNEAIKKSSVPRDIDVYFASQNNLDTNKMEIGYINPEHALDSLIKSDKINLYCFHLKQNDKAIGLTNIMYFDNNNKTLPIGMDIDDKVLIDLKEFKLELNRQKLFRMNQIVNQAYIKTKIICVYEYNIAKGGY